MEDQKICAGFLADILRQCKVNPSRFAFVGPDGRRYTFGDYYELARRVSGYIRSRGIPSGSFVVINLPNGMEYFAVELGVWLCGCAVVPVSPLYPEERIDFICGHCESSLLVDTVILDEIRRSDPLEVCEPTEKIAAIFYTSGSTGNPKGVMHTFESLDNIGCLGECYEVSPDDCFCYMSAMSFVASMIPVQFLRSGACVRLPDRETITDIRKLKTCFDDGTITAAIVVPSLHKQLDLSGNKSLRVVFTGSERVSNIEPESGYKLIALYGMTESLFCSAFNITSSYPNTPVGKPFSRVEMKLDEDGEICLRGSLSPGYFKDPERSAALWKGGWLHTGDIGRILPDGNYEYVNRKDWMVKINGQRVETGEVIHAIKEVPGVSDATAKGFTLPSGRQYLVAYYVSDVNLDEESIRESISRKLAPYMIPSHFVRMAALPLNVNGKIDIKSLQSPEEMIQPDCRCELVEPGTPNEKVLCKAFESSLGISPVSVTDDFFSLGGDSIRVMQLQLACPELNLSSSLIYRFRTVRAICAALESEACLEQSTPVSSDSPCPLSRTQAGIFVECMSRRGEAVYNNPFLYRFTEPVDASRLALACEKAVKAHPMLFASIIMDENGNPLQKENSSDGFRIEVETLSDTKLDSIRPALVRPFDLLSDRLFRIRVFKTESAVWLFTDFHHIVFDGTSNGIFLEDVSRAYAGGDVEPETFTGFDLSREEQRLRLTPYFEECRQWNIDTFREPDMTSFPDPDRFGNAVSFAKFEVDTLISVHSFEKAAERLGITGNVLATGAFGHMLGACTHARSSAFATIYNGRKSIKTVRTMSMMVKTLPVYCKWGGDTSVGEYFDAVKSQLVGAMAHDLFSFSEICRSTSYDSRLIFSYQDELLELGSMCGSACEAISLLDNATGEPIAVQLYKSRGKMFIRTEYRSDMFTDSYIRKFISCFSSILSGLLLCGRDLPLSSIPLVSVEDGDSLLSTGRGPILDFDRNLTFVRLFRRQVAARPDAIALVDEKGSLSYSQLDKASDALASLLVSEGVAREEFVALMLPRLNLFPISYIATFKSGAAYVPMDDEYPVDRLQYMLEDSGAGILLTTRDIYERKCSEGSLSVPKVIFVEDILDQAAEVPAVDNSSPESLAYMIYTSGTTGKPKGVMIEHHSLVNFVHWFSQVCEIGPGTRVGEHASFSFDGSLCDLMTPLCFGGELHILASSIRKDLPAIYRYFCENRIETIVLTTQLGSTMLRMYDLKLKHLMMGGEKLNGGFSTSVDVINGYGPTEFTIASSYYVVDPTNVPDNIPIGRPVPNTVSAVVDSCGRLLPAGIAGELVLVGEQLSRGYWHRPDITSERFTPCPFIENEKMYHTGDLVKWNDDGELLFLGRIDTQVKLRGFRIELGEIESNISKFEGIRSAVVAVREISGLQHLCAYYVSDSQIDKAELRAYLASSLTDYMVPTAYVQMDSFPMTPNGKVDLRSLPLPEIKAEETVAPEGEVESKLFDIVSEYLGVKDFGVTSNLISLGLTSLGAITLSLQIERKASLNVPSPKILESPTIRQWAEYLSGSRSDAPKDFPSYEKRDAYPLTDNQTGIYVDWERHKESIQYNVPMLVRFRNVSPETVVEAVRSFIGAHPYIKTHLSMIDGQLMQVRNDSIPFDVPVHHLGKMPDKEFFQSLLQPFNLFEGPLFRFSIYIHDDSLWLLSDFHHIVFDGGSEAIFLKELTSSCDGRSVEAETFSAFDYSLYYDEWKHSDEYSKAGQYFTALLEDTVPGSIPSTVGPEDSGSATFIVDVPRPALSSLCRKAGVTENSLFLTAVTEVLHRFSRESNIAILTVSSGRSLRALERTCGMFVQTLPIVSHQTVRKVGESLVMMHNQIVETLARDKFPYTSIVEKTGLKAGILLAYQGEVLDCSLSVGGKAVEVTGLALDTAKFPLSINVLPTENTTQMSFEYDRAVFSATDIESYANAVRSFILNMTAAGTDTFVGDVPCVTDVEASELVSLGSGPSLPVSDGTIVDMFKAFARQHPDDPALTDEEQTLSYAELDRRSDLLAGVLLSAGLHKEDFVSLILPRTGCFVVSYLATFKAGGAYVPMDYEYPVDRIRYMIEDSMSRFLITTTELYKRKSAEGDLNVENVIFLDELDFIKTESSTHLNKSVPEGLAYMIYTSGTTGKPKGVMIEHRAVMNMIHWNRDLSGLERGTHVASHPSFSFDASVMDLMTSVAFGGHLYIIPESHRKDPELLHRYLNDNAIEAMVTSTQLGMMLLSSYKLPIRYIMLGGEKLTGQYDRSIKVVNGYGPTEFTVCSSYHILDPDNESDNIPIGRAVPNTISAIVDPSGHLLPKGVPGELVLIGPQIARGYWNKDEITSKRFVPCPFVPGSKMYHTGDLARWSEDGELLFQGRIDTQVKLRGFRIELGEIESQIANFESISASVATVRDFGGVQHLCAYFTAPSKIDIPSLKSHLSSCLTAYMVPDSLMQLDSFPLTPNGKIDLKKLPDPELSQAPSGAFEAPEGEMETMVADIFSQILHQKEPLSRNASFFAMGGTSLLVMRVVVSLAEHGSSVTYGDIFKYPTPRSLAAFIEGFEAGRGASPQPVTGTVPDVAPDVPSFTVGEDGYDYSSINSVLKTNCIPEIGNMEELDTNPLGDVLLLGSTGYLGIHILNNLLSNSEGKVWCIIRPKKGVTCEGRLKSYLMYYFDKTYAELLGKRLFILEGDMTDDTIMERLLAIKVDTVINCAANVKHFAAGNEIEKINLNGTEKLIEYCIRTGSRLIHTSTHSISGQTEGGKPHVMLESELYFGQKMMTKYQTSKFAAERAILEACAGKGLRAKIVRLGNLMPRQSDGEFQINFENNGFMARMRAYYLIGCIPLEHLHSSVEFAPIDETADAILTLARTPDKFTVFHPFNNHTIYIDDVVAVMRHCGLDIKITGSEEFDRRLEACLKDEHLNPFITTLLAYGSHNNFVVNNPSLEFTVNVLNAMDWRWPITGSRYLSDAFDKMIALQYFER